MSAPDPTPPPRRLTCEHCAEILGRLDTSLARAGVKLNQNAKADLADVRWLASGTGLVLDERGVPLRDPARTIRGFTDALLVEKTAAALDIASSIPGFEAEARRLKHWRLWPATDAQQMAVDCMYQFDIAAMLRLGQKLRITIAEPDLRIGGMSVACKQPRSRNAVPEAVAAGSTQVRNQTGKGMVAVSLQNLAESFVQGSHDTMRDWASNQMRDILEPLVATIDHRLRYSPPRVEADGAKGVLGVLFTRRFLHLDPERGIRVILQVIPFVNPAADPPTTEMFHDLADGLPMGDIRLPQAS